jgi:hypothetical protein
MERPKNQGSKPPNFAIPQLPYLDEPESKNFRSQKLNPHKNKKSFFVFVPFLCLTYFARKKFQVTKTELSQKQKSFFRVCSVFVSNMLLLFGQEMSCSVPNSPIT